MAHSSFSKLANILRTLTCLLASTQLLGHSGYAAAQSPTITQQTSVASTDAPVRLPGHMARELQDGSAAPLSHYDPAQKLRLAVVLALPHPAEEQQFLAAIQDKKSPLFHQFLTQEEWNTRFAPTAESEAAVVAWAQSQGLTVTHRYSNRLVVDLEAPSGTIEKALSVTINNYQLPARTGVEARTVYSNDRNPSVPSNLSGVVDAVLGLNSIVAMRPAGGTGRLVPRPDYSPGPVTQLGDTLQQEAQTEPAASSPASGSLTNGTSTPNGYTPQYFWNSDAYNYQALMNQGHCCNPLNNSSGHSPRESSIAIAAFGDVSFSDINAFKAYFSNLALYVDKIYIDGTYTCNNVPTTDDNCLEVTMDTEWSLATANSQGSAKDTARVVVYEGFNYNNATIMDVYTQMEADAHARTMSTSWGIGETLQYSNSPELDAYDSTMQSIDKIFSSMSGQGWTLVAASGDQGATGGCTDALLVQFPSSDPNVVGVGGTELSEGNPYEVAWTGANYRANPNANPPTADACDSNQGGSTGGFSQYFPAPGFQSGMGFSKRAVPDISLDTTHGHDVYLDGSWIHPGGTSVAAPMMAGFFAQANAYLLSVGDICGSKGDSACAPIGNANYPIYAEGNHPNAAHYPFYDITQGCNTNDLTQQYGLGAYCAGPGFDEVTGWGSANMLQLAWAINWELIPASGEPYITWKGPDTHKWYNTNQTVEWTIHDWEPTGSTPGSGIAGETQGWDSLVSDPSRESHGGSGNSFYSGPQFTNDSAGCLAFEPNGCSGGVTQGCHTAHARGWNNQGWSTAGNSSYPESYGPICYDTVAPTLKVTVSPASPTATGWYTTPVTITMSATDPGGSGASGVANIYYGTGSAACSTGGTSGCSTYYSPVTLNTSQFIVFTAFSEDKAGNFSSSNEHLIAIDTVPPVTTAGFSGVLADGIWDNSVSIVLKGTDNFSGVKTTYYKLDSGAQTAYTAPIKISTIGMHTIYYWSVDNAGNIEKQNGNTFQLDSTTTTTLTATPNPSLKGQTVKLTATVAATDAGTPAGTVTFYNGSTKLAAVTATAGVAVLTTASLPVGSDNLWATYTASGYELNSTSPAFSQTVQQATTTTFTPTPSSAVYGTKVTLTAKVVASISGTPTGTVDFYDGTQLLGSAALNTTGIAAYPTSTLTVGVHSLKAVYLGQSSYSASTSAASSETITKATPAIVLKASAKTSTFDENLTFTATVTSPDGTPTGTVTFFSNKVAIGEATLVAGVATLNTKTLSIGTDSITATYGGSTDFNGINSTATPVEVTAAATSTTLTSSVNPATAGTSVTFAATVTSPAGSPAGTVTFKDGTTILGSETLVDDKAALSTKSLAAGTHSITATYTATTDYSASTSPVITETIKEATPAL